jgi:hypothetical protein
MNYPIDLLVRERYYKDMLKCSIEKEPVNFYRVYRDEMKTSNLT